jgi:hypothetical protein
MRIAPIVLLATAVAGWFLFSRNRFPRVGARMHSFADAGASLNPGERLRQTHSAGVLPSSVVDSDKDSDRLAVLGGETPRSDRIIPGLPDYLRGG